MDWFDNDVDIFSGAPLTSHVSLDTVVQQICDDNDSGPLDKLNEQSDILSDNHVEVVHRRAPSMRKSTIPVNPSDSTTSSREAVNKKKTTPSRLMLDVHMLVAMGGGSSTSGSIDVDAQVRHAIALGAKPPKREYVNYKKLQETRAEERRLDRESREQFKTQSKFVIAKRGKNKKSKLKKGKK